ncbi:MAG TPA: transcriptional regulator [Planctomycetaceae bacterium]|nr:transcriptional regulator [Planctomycetaceae bacterium]
MMRHPMTNPRLHSQKTELPRELVELRERIAALGEADRRALEPLVQRVIDSTRRRQRIMQLVQEALSQLRLDMKYLVFDLEATRRERDALRERSDED